MKEGILINILHINCNYSTTVLHKIMIKNLSLKGVNNTVFCPIYNEKNTIIDVNENEYICKCFNYWDRFLFFLKQAKIRKAVQKEIQVKNNDIIHAYTLFTDGSCARHLSHKYNKPYVVAVRGTDINYFGKYRFYLKHHGYKILRDSSIIYCLSPAYVEKVLKLFVPKKYQNEILSKIQVVPNGIDDFWLKNTFKDKDCSLSFERYKKKQIKLIFAGQVSKIKNVKLICQAIDILKEKGWQVSFDVIGKIEDPNYYNNIREYCNYYEYMPKEQLINKYRESDIFVMPSITETFGLVYVEAMSQGLPVIYSKGEGFDNQFPEGTVGYGVDKKSAEALAIAILNVFEEYERMTHNCIDLCNKFNWNSICDEYYKDYETIMVK